MNGNVINPKDKNVGLAQSTNEGHEAGQEFVLGNFA
jgi:hypothetical protein